MLANVLIILCLIHHHAIISNIISEEEDTKELGIRKSFFGYIHHLFIFYFQGFKQAIKYAIEKVDNLAISRYFVYFLMQ